MINVDAAAEPPPTGEPLLEVFFCKTDKCYRTEIYWGARGLPTRVLTHADLGDLAQFITNLTCPIEPLIEGSQTLLPDGDRLEWCVQYAQFAGTLADLKSLKSVGVVFRRPADRQLSMEDALNAYRARLLQEPDLNDVLDVTVPAWRMSLEPGAEK